MRHMENLSFLDEIELKKGNSYFRKNIKECNTDHNQMIIMNYWLKLDIELDYQLDNQTAIKYEWANPAFEPNY